MKWGCGFCRRTLTLVLLLICLCGNSILSHEGDGDRDVLLELKSLVSDPSGILTSWDAESQLSHCEWYGVSCDAESRVSIIQLVGGCFDGEIGVKADNCSFGRLEGKFTSRIGELKNLKVLSLAFNRFSGVIPAEIWELENLDVIDLEGNMFTGEIPRSFSGLRKLSVLNLRFNRFSGRVPLVSNLRFLKVLDLAGNKLDGKVPEFVDRYGNGCQYLDYLDLSGNYLSGVIPCSLGKCRRVKVVLIFSNNFTGSIPKEIGSLRNLEVLDVSRNSLSGFIPAELGNCALLSVLVLSNSLDPFKSWGSTREEAMSSTYDEERNYFQDSIPSEVAALSKLNIFWAPRAGLEGQMPQICDSSLEVLNLAENQLVGDITGLFTLCKNLRHLNLSKNKLVGRLDEMLRIPCMTLIDISSNLMTGTIPNFVNNNCTIPRSIASVHINQWINLTPEHLSTLESEQVIIHDHYCSDNSFTGPIPQLQSKVLAKHVCYAFFAAKNGLTGEMHSYLMVAPRYLHYLMIDLENNKLSGDLPPTIGLLKSLNLSNNLISGTVPQSLGDLVTLELLDLSGNKLQGRIPDTIGQLKNIRFLSLSANNLTGAVPSTFGQLSSLTTLKLSSNSLSGKIPEVLACLGNLTNLELDNNQLSGDIPTGLVVKLFNVSVNNLTRFIKVKNEDSQMRFSRRAILLSSGETDSLNYTSSERDTDQNVYGSGRLNSIEIASIVSASAIVSVLLALVILFIYMRKWAPDSRVQVSAPREMTLFTDIGAPITFDKISNSTANFNASNCIGNGGFGATYRAEIAPGVVVAVKRLSVGRFHGVQQFHAEIKTLERVRHPNLVTLIGYHASETEMFLIYNYLPGGNLAEFIKERNEKATDWKVLHQIALDIAQALAYLHDQCVPRVVHRDVKPSNILLDNELNAYLSDFGLSRLLGTSETHATTGVAGTFGYLAPEYAMTNRVSDKADVYSYGIVLLELLSDKKILDPSFSAHEDGFTIVSWASMLLREGRAKDVFNPRLWETGPHKKLVDALHLAVRCTVETLSIRPTMRQVTQQLKHLQPRNQVN